MKGLKGKKLFLLDMDGTIYIDDVLFDGTLDFLEYVKKIGGKYIFLTNNSSKGVDKYIEKLGRLGIDAEPNDFMTSIDASVNYLKEKKYKKIYGLGTESFKKQLIDSGLCVVDELCDDIDCLIISNDTELTFKKLEDACILLGRNVDYAATNPDWVCPTSYGYAPDCGSFCEMLERATKRIPFFIGKPQPEMVYCAMKKTGFSKDETVILGDRLYTDIACGVNAGISSVFVLSGEGTRAELEMSNVKPEFVYENIREIYNDLISR